MIETERLILRPFREGDAVEVFEYLEKPMVNITDLPGYCYMGSVTL